MLAEKEGGTIHDALMMSDGQQMFGNILVFPFIGITFAYQNTAMLSIEFLWIVGHDGSFGFVVIIDGSISHYIGRIFQNG